MENALSKLLASLPHPPRLLALGEPTHFVEEFLRARNRVFKHLVQHHGFRSIALESCAIRGLLVDDYVTGRSDAGLDEVMREGFSHGFGRLEGNRELVEWMRANGNVRFFGFDAPLEMESAPSPRGSLSAISGYVRSAYPDGLVDDLCGPDERWSAAEAVMDAARSPGASPEAAKLRLIADDLNNALLSQAPQLIADSSPGEYRRMRLHGRTASGLLRYHAACADPAPSRWEALSSLRDTMMAENLWEILDFGPTLVFAHNSHLQREQSRMMWGWEPDRRLLRWWSAGAIVSARLGGDYAVIAGALGDAPGLDVPPAGSGTPEGFLAALPDDIVASSLLPEGLRRRDYDGFRYAPLDPDHLSGCDGILFIRKIVADSTANS